MAGHDTVLLFEYATCTAQEMPPHVAAEGHGMFRTLYQGFENPLSFYQEPRYMEVFMEHLSKAAYALAIAPETDGELYRLTRAIEGSGCENLGSSAKAVKSTSDKLLTWKRLRDLSPKTELLKNGRTALELPLVAKPRDGVSCEGVMLVEDEKALERIPEGYIVQEYIRGRPMSASILIGDEPRILSINTQEIVGFQYFGATLPVELSHTEPLIEAVERFPGLHGYVGVDFVAAEDGPVVIEINPRPTTPIIGLKAAFGVNISELILRSHLGRGIPAMQPQKKVLVRKRHVKEEGGRPRWTMEVAPQP
ncbi:MAG: ATP-grasp domain-containing protein [Methanobacteriota archaeon]|nr:MAG: ATP-grasp domain-containing protein [Euryarchaeota archaeon]